MGLCFGFVMKIALVTQRCFSYHGIALAQHLGLSSFSCFPASEQAGDMEEVGKSGGDTAGTCDPHRPKGYPRPQDLMLSN